MKCPKCHYLSVDDEARCRNCGFTFAMTPGASPGADLALRPDEAVGPLMDLALRGDGLLASDAEGARPEPTVPPPAMHTPPSPPPAADLPLFTGGDESSDRAVRAVPPARPPLAVRRPTVTPRLRPTPNPFTVPPHGAAPAMLPPAARRPDRAPPRSDSRLGGLPLAPDTAPQAVPSADVTPDARAVVEVSTASPGVAGLGERESPPDPSTELPDAAPTDTAPWGPRLAAAALDLLLLGVIDGVVLSFTAQIVGVPVREFTMAPLVPLLGFLLVLDLAYAFSLVAAAGQTLGKMLFGLKVVSEEGRDVTAGAAALRAVVGLATVLLAGVPYLFAFADARARAPHDRVAGTRVVAL